MRFGINPIIQTTGRSTDMAITAHDIVSDSPTNNFAVLNILSEQGAALNNGNLRISDSSGNGALFRPTSLAFPNIGKWYAEFYYEAVNNNNDIYIKVHHDGLSLSDNRPLSIRSNSGSAIIYDESLTTSNSATGTVANGAVVGILVDFDNNKVIFNEGGQYSGEVPITSNDGYNYFYGIGFDNQTGTKTVIANFGQDSTFNAGTSIGSVADKNGFGSFKHTPVNNNSTQITDFKALCTANLPDLTPDVIGDVPQDYFKAVKYVGDFSSPATISVGFNPDLIWIKQRTPYAGQSHCIYDSVRGVSKRLYSDSTSQEITPDGNGGVTNFSDNNGFELTRPTNAAFEGFDSSMQMIAWCWKAGGNSNTFNIDGTGYSTYSALQTANTSLPASSTSGMIVPSGMSINTDAGFSIVKYPGTGETATVPHGLDKAPEMVIIKKLTTDTGGNNWAVYHKSVNENYFLYLNGTLGKLDYPIWNDTPPSSTVITLGDDSQVGEANRPNIDSICYAWHSVENYSKFGSYTGNGSPDGPFVYCGFRPAFVMVKRTTGTFSATDGLWTIVDSTRRPFNGGDPNTLYANNSSTEFTGSANKIDLFSNGFKLADSNNNVNSSEEFIFMAFAEQSFKFSNAR